MNSVFKTDIKSESLAEPTLAELNANEDEDQILEGFDVSSFFMDSHDHDKPMTVTTSSNLSNSSPISMTSGNGGKNLDMFGQHLTSSQLSTVQDIKMEPTTVLGKGAPIAVLERSLYLVRDSTEGLINDFINRSATKKCEINFSAILHYHQGHQHRGLTAVVVLCSQT